MGIIDGLMNTANVLGSAVAIHSSLKYFQNQIPKNNHYPHTYPVLTLNAQKTVAKLNENIVFYGTASIPGIIEIYSHDLMETKVLPEKGKYYAVLYFTKTGVYEIWAKIYNHKSNIVYVTIE
jgi:uncharacterized protein (DUF952 family)